jgi:hypothetical protein
LPRLDSSLVAGVTVIDAERITAGTVTLHFDYDDMVTEILDTSTPARTASR